MKPQDLHTIPFSQAGSYLKITANTASDSGRLMIGTARKTPFAKSGKAQWPHDFFEIALMRGNTEIRYFYETSPWRLHLQCHHGQVTIAFLDNDTLAFKAEGVSVKLIPCKAFGAMQWRGADQACLFDYAGLCKPLARAGRGTRLTVEESLTAAGEEGGAGHDTPFALVFTSKTRRMGGAVRFRVQEEKWEEPLPPFEEIEKARHEEWKKWLDRLPEVPRRFRDAAESAWLILGGSIVQPDGPITRRAMLMSKNWMNQVWSWDNCFNALAVAQADPQLAFDQLRLFFDHQASTGAFPDSVNNLFATYTFVKPPIYGWTITRLTGLLGAAKMRKFYAQAYEPVTRQTEFWYAYRDVNQNGMCEYLHGNDSGWDNATVFDQGYPTEGADLAAHLVMQMEGLAAMADALGRKKAAAQWRQRARTQLDRLLDHSLRVNRFVSPLSDRLGAQDPGSLLNYIPMVLGRRLPDAARRRMVKDLSPNGFFLTEYGLATQRLHSKAYTPDGYWRGPIWAPSTYLIFDGLVDAGETKLAAIIAERFCDMCARDGVMWENYDALTGDGLRCPAYTWTAAVFLLLAQWLNHNAKK